MNLLHVLAGFGRRWYVALPGVLIVVGLCLYAFPRVPVSYSASSSMILLPPDTVTEEGNPYLFLGGLGPAQDVLVRRVNADIVRGPIAGEFPVADYTVFADKSSSGPIIAIEGTAPTADAALQIIRAVDDAVPIALTEMQTELGVPSDARITLSIISVDSKATVDSSTRTQVVVIVAALGLGATLLLTGLTDSLILARRSRIVARKAATESSRDAESPDDSTSVPAASGP